MKCVIISFLYICQILTVAIEKTKEQMTLFELRKVYALELKCMDKEAKKISILDNLCILEGGDKNFNAMFQALVSNRNFLGALILNDFKDRHTVCTTLQRVAYHMITKPRYNLTKDWIDILEIKIIRNFVNDIFIKPKDYISHFLHYLICEIDEKKSIESPFTFYSKDIYDIKCSECSKIVHLSVKIYERIAFGNMSLSEGFERGTKCYNSDLSELFTNCKKCKIVTMHKLNSFVMITSNNLIINIEDLHAWEIESDPAKAILRFNEKIVLDKFTYEITAMLCMDLGKKRPRPVVVANKNGKWQKFSEKILSNESETEKKVKKSPWLCFLRRVDQ